MKDHPFGPFKNPGDPLNANIAETRIHCPKCKSTEFTAIDSQFGLFRRCLGCKNEWSGGIATALPDLDISDVPPSSIPAPDEPRTQPYFGPDLRSYYGEDD